MTATAVITPQLRDATAPPERRGIARDAVRMLVTDRQTGTQAHHRFFDLPSLLRPGDLLVVNDSATLPAALPARRANGESLTLHVSTMIDRRIFMVEPRSPVLCGEELTFTHGGSVVMIAPVEPEHPRLWYGWFQLPQPMNAYLLSAGEPIRYGYVEERFPLDDYQTIFARELGSSEMPSAGRPFTARVLRGLRQRGVELATITLHCGIASFEAPERPGTERFAISPHAAGAINLARDQHRRVIAVGTTVVRALETAFHDGQVIAASGWTDLIIERAHRLRSVDALITGFHHEGATHQWMLDAFLDGALLQNAYAEAAAHSYYRHEFGDVQLIV
jgi:S-adenosylmethionine:tRNA ribosyltransferase-isomerase